MTEAPREAARRSKTRSLMWAIAKRVLVIAAIILTFWISGCMERLFYHPTVEPTPAPRQFVGAESVWFNSSDGTRLHGWFIPAQYRGTANNEAPIERAATILHAHGNAGSINSHLWFTEYLPRHGFNLLIFDYRGYGQSEGAAARRGPLIQDTHAALDYLLTRHDVDPHRIGVYGQSLGGTIAINVMAERPEIKAAVIESAFVSWRDMAACALGGDGANIICRAVAAAFIRDSNRADVAIAAVHRPMLLLHGTHDSIIPVSHSRSLAAASGGWARLVELSGGDHNSLRDTHPEIEQLVIDFFRKNLKTAGD